MLICASAHRQSGKFTAIKIWCIYHGRLTGISGIYTWIKDLIWHSGECRFGPFILKDCIPRTVTLRPSAYSLHE